LSHHKLYNAGSLQGITIALLGGDFYRPSTLHGGCADTPLDTRGTNVGRESSTPYGISSTASTKCITLQGNFGSKSFRPTICLLHGPTVLSRFNLAGKNRIESTSWTQQFLRIVGGGFHYRYGFFVLMEN
jgi:hypothetical protein